MNTMSRFPICLCLDTSASMHYYMDELNKAVDEIYDIIKSDELASVKVDMSIVTFDSTTRFIEHFLDTDKQERQKLEAKGMTCMGEGVNLSLDLLAKKIQEYKDAGVDCYKAVLILMTDGSSNGNQGEFNRAVQRTVDLVKHNKLNVFSIGVGEGADMDVLKMFSYKRPALRLRDFKFKELFKWVGDLSIEVSNSIVGETVLLDTDSIFNPDTGWGML